VSIFVQFAKTIVWIFINNNRYKKEQKMKIRENEYKNHRDQWEHSLPKRFVSILHSQLRRNQEGSSIRARLSTYLYGKFGHLKIKLFPKKKKEFSRTMVRS